MAQGIRQTLLYVIERSRDSYNNMCILLLMLSPILVNFQTAYNMKSLTSVLVECREGKTQTFTTHQITLWNNFCISWNYFQQTKYWEFNTFTLLFNRFSSSFEKAMLPECLTEKNWQHCFGEKSMMQFRLDLDSLISLHSWCA